MTARPLTAVFGGISKIYDGSIAAQVTSSDDRLANDILSVVRTANFDDRHVGAGKTVTINGLSLSGPDANNYALTMSSATVTSRIDQALSTTWVGGGASNDWMDAANWAGAVLPDRANVANVLINANTLVTFSASAGSVSLTSLVAPNTSLTQTGGQLATSGAMTVGELWQSSGTLAVGELLTVNRGFSQTGNGTITAASGATITNSVGNVSLGSFTSNGPVALTNNGGGVAQLANTTLIASEGLIVVAQQGATPKPIDLSNSGNEISGNVSLTGSSTKLRSSGPMTTTLSGSEGGTLQSDGILTVAGTLTGSTSNLNLIAPDVQLGALSVGGNIDVSGATSLGASVSSGGTQRWRGAVNITADVAISGAGMQFDGNLNGPHRLVLSDSGNTLIAGAVGNVSAPLHFETNGAGTTTISGGLVRSSGTASQVYNTNVVVTTDTVFDTTNNGGLPGGAAITFAGTLNGTTANTQSVTLNAGTGGIVTTAAIGNAVSLKTLTLTNSGGATFSGAVTAESSVMIDATAANQWVKFNGSLQTPQLTASAGSYNLAMTGTLNSIPTASLLNAGQLVIGDAANDSFAFANGLTATAQSSVKLGGSITTTNAAITVGGADTSVTLQAASTLNSFGGAVTFGGVVDSDNLAARSLTINAGTGNVQFAAAVGSMKALGDVLINSTGNTRFDATVTTATLTTDAPGSLSLNGGAITTTGAQTYNDAVTLGANTTLSGTDVMLASTVNGAYGLTVNGSGVTSFGGAVSVASVTTDAAGTLVLNGGSVSTTGNQNYGDAITLGANTTLNGADISLGSTVNGAYALTVNGSGVTSFGGAVSVASVTTDAAGTLVLNGGSISTTGNQNYGDAITLGANTTLSGVDMTVGSTVNGAHSLTINGSGVTTFGGAVSVASVTTDTVGTLVLNGGSISTTGNQNYGDAITLGANTTLNGADMSFGSTVNGTYALTVNGSGVTTFGGAVSVASVTTDAAGTLVLNGGSISTTGNQNYGDAITLGANTTLSGVDMTVGSTVNGAHSLTVNCSGVTTFGGAVSVTSVTTDAAGTLVLNGGSISTTGNQNYGDAITLGANTTLNGADMSFGSTVNGTYALTVNGSGVTTFGGAVSVANVTTDAAGTLVLNGGSISTTGNQNYGDAITLGANTTLNGADISFGSTINGTYALTVNGSGVTTFGGAVSVASVTTDAAGTLVLNGGSISTTGNQNYGDAITLGANTTLNGADISFGSTINGTYALTVNGSGVTTFGGAVSVASVTTDAAGTLVLNGGSISATGNQNYGDAMTLGANTTLSGADISFGSTVNGAYALTVNASGVTTFGGAVSVASVTTDAAGTLVLNGGSISTTGNQNYGDAITLGANTTLSGVDMSVGSTVNGAHSLTVNGSGVTTFGGAVSVTSVTTDAAGTLVLNGGSISTTGNQNYGDAITLGANTTLNGADMSFGSTVNGAHSLTVNGSGVTTFGGAVSVASVTTDAAGTLVLNGGSISTTGNQNYGDAITLGANTTLNGADMSFDSTVNGAYALTVNASGVTTFGGAVSVASVTTDAAGTLVLNGGSISTTGNQNYGDAITLGANTTLSGVDMTVGSTVNGAHSLTVNGSGVTTFGGAVSVTSVTTDAAGTLVLNGGNISTTGNQNYGDAMTLGANTTLSGTNISFGSTVNGGFDLVVNASGTTTFSGAVGNTDALRSVTTDAAGSTILVGAAVTTSAAQSWNDILTLADNTILTGTAITFGKTVDGAFDLTVNASGTTRFNQAVGGGTPLRSITTDAAGDTVLAGGVLNTTAAQNWNDIITLADNTILTGAAITFGKTVDGAFSMLINNSGVTALNAAVGSITPLTSFESDAAGSLLINGGLIKTTGAQTYRDPVSLGADTEIRAHALQFASITTADNLTIVTASAQEIGNLHVGGNLALTTGAGGVGGVTQAVGSVLQVTGNTVFTADTAANQDAVLDGANNNFTGTLSFAKLNTGSWRDLSVNDAVGNLTLGTVAANRNVALTAVGALDLGTLAVGGNLNASAHGNLTQQGALVVGGTTNLLAGSGAITLANAANDFGGAVSLEATAAAITDSVGGLVLDQISTTVGGLVAVSTNGAITQAVSSVITTAADSSFSATTSAGGLAADIVLNNAGNNFAGVLNLDGANISVQSSSSNGLTLGQVSAAANLSLNLAAGNLDFAHASVAGDMEINTSGGNVNLGQTVVAHELRVTTGGGNISQSGQLGVAGASTLNAGAGDISLPDTTNYFSQALSLTAGSTTLANSGNLILGDIHNNGNFALISSGSLSLTSATIVNGNLSLTSGGDLDLGSASVTSSLALGGNLTLVSTGGNVSVGAATIAGTMNVTTQGGAIQLGTSVVGGNLLTQSHGGDITQTGPLQITGSTTLNAGAGAVVLNDAANDFGSTVDVSAVSASLVDSNALNLGTLHVDTNLALQSSGGLTLGTGSVGGTLTVNSHNNAITQQAGGLAVEGNVSLVAGSGAITLADAANHFAATVDASGVAIMLHAADALSLGTVSSATTLEINSGGAVSLGLTTVGSNLSVTSASGGITQTAALQIAGTTTLNAVNAAIVLDNTANDFASSVAVTAASASLVDNNALTLGALNVDGSLAVQSGGALSLGSGTVGGTLSANSSNHSITQQVGGLAVSGAVRLVAGTGDITLGDAANHFAAAVDASGAAIVLHAADALTLGVVNSSSTLELNSGGALSLGDVHVGTDLSVTSASGGVTQTASLVVAGRTALDAGSGNIVLTDSANQFAQAVVLRGQAITLASAGALVLGDVSSGGNLTLTTTGGSISQAAGATLVAQGASNLRASNAGSPAAIKLDNAGNNFVGAIAATGAAITLRDDVGSMKIGTISGSGLFDAQARGGAIMLEPGALQIALGGIRMTPDPRPMGIAYPTSAPESLRVTVPANSQAAPVAKPAVETRNSGSAGWSVVATEQSTANTGSSTTTVIKVAEAPLSQADKNLIPVGKVFALGSAQVDTKIIQSASFEILDGFNAGQATLEMGKSATIETRVDNAKGSVAVSGDASVADYDKLLQGINLRVNGDAPSNSVIRIRVTLTDQNGQAESKVVTVRMNKPVEAGVSLNK